MSYQVLARKWRPRRFSDVVGQQHVLAALENGLREQRLHHAYLFSGTRGVGKTSIARLFAKGLNCETGITATPCDQCTNCLAIDEGRFIDLIEIDAASRTKVEDTRELLDNVQYKPTVGRFKVYLIDEVHMLSRHSFNALLKTLEEPPEYVKFLLATTDPQKLPITILSRCMQFHLRALDQQQIADHLEFVLQQEQISFEINALQKLAKAAQGSIRDSLSLTDQAIAVSNGNITLDIVNQMLGLMDSHYALELVQALAQADGEQAMKLLQKIASKGADWAQLLNELAEVLHTIAMLQLLPHQHSDEPSLLHFLAKQLPPEDVQFFYQLMLTGKKELPYAPEQRVGVEMTILRALAFHPKHIETTISPTPVAKKAENSTAIEQPISQVTQLKQQLAQTLPQSTQKNRVEPPNNTVSPAPVTANISSNIETHTPNIAQNSTDNLNTEQSTESSPAAVALAAAQAREALKQKRALIEKKKSDPVITQHKLSSQSHSESEIQQRLAKFIENPTALSDETAQLAPQSEQAQMQSDSDEYRWTWLNPELEQQEDIAKPSDIKHAILQERTPELINKTIALSREQDEWSRIVAQLHLGGLSRQLALNSYLRQKENQHLHLVLRANMAHLDTPEAQQSLQQALQAIDLSYSLTLAQHADDGYETPLELRRTIFTQLTQEAKTALRNDTKLALLINAFDAEIDESTIRAVAE